MVHYNIFKNARFSILLFIWMQRCQPDLFQDYRTQDSSKKIKTFLTTSWRRLIPNLHRDFVTEMYSSFSRLSYYAVHTIYVPFESLL